MIKTWNFEFVEHPGREPRDIFAPELASRTFSWLLDLCADLEDSGFQGIFFSEHHFNGNISPSPNLLVAAAVARTRKLRLGILGQVLPLHEPFRVAEEIAMLDHLTGGRLEIGYASGTGPAEGRQIGLGAEEIRSRFEEALEIIDLALAENPLNYSGRFWNYKNLSITPRPRQQDPIKWVVGRSPESAVLAAKRRYRFCSGNAPVDFVVKSFDAYRETAGSLGRPASPDMLAIRRQTLVCETDSEAEALHKIVLPVQVERVGAMFARQAASLSGGSVMPAERAHAYQTIDAPAPVDPRLTLLYANHDEQIFGSPRTVADQIIDQCRRLGAAHFVSFPYTTMTLDEARTHYRLWGRVNEILARADIGA